MANEEHFAILKQGIEVWNQWRANNPTIKPDLSGISLYDCKPLQKFPQFVDFTGANFSETNLSKINFKPLAARGRYYMRAHLAKVNFTKANLSEAVIIDGDLNEAVFIDADLSEANLEQATLKGADLSKALLGKTNLLQACLEKAILTGACIEDWQINSQTNLDGIICDFVYLKAGFLLSYIPPAYFDPGYIYRRYSYKERRPSSGNFVPGEFTKLFQKARETLDLIFLNGIDWQAFLVSFQQLQVEAGENVLSIQSIENKDDGAFVIRVSVPPELDKSQIEQYFEGKYQLAIEAKDKQYRKYLRKRLKDKDDVIANYLKQIEYMRQANTQLIEVAKIMAEKEGSKYYINQSQIGNFIDTAQSGSRQQGKAIQHNYAPEQKQTLAEAAEEIQELLKQLEETNPTATEDQQIEHINDETSPSFKRRAGGALKALGESTFDEFFLENKYLKVAKATVKGWIKPE
jgi:uncharacterized protein YjbI with pentapeptide repeats